MASLKFSLAATSRRAASRAFSSSELFQLTMNPSMPAERACTTCFLMTLTWSLEYRPTDGKSRFARFHEDALNQMKKCASTGAASGWTIGRSGQARWVEGLAAVVVGAADPGGGVAGGSATPAGGQTVAARTSRASRVPRAGTRTAAAARLILQRGRPGP